MSNSKAPKFKVNDKAKSKKYENIFSKGYTENSREIFNIASVLNDNAWAYKIKDLNEEKVIGSFYKNNFCGVKNWSYYQEPDSHIRDKFKVVLDLSNYAMNKEVDHPTDVNKSDLAAKNILLICKLKLTT